MTYSFFTKTKILIAAAIILILLGSVLMLSRRKKSHPSLPPAGVINDIQSPEEQQGDIQILKLQERLPIKEKQFTITYDPNTYKFLVSLHGIMTLRTFFLEWVKENHFEQIPQEKFQFNSR